MNINRKIQLAAAAVALNGALALSLLSSSPALASTCGTPIKIICQSSHSLCLADGASICAANAAPGCTLTAWGCSADGPAPCFGAGGGLVCDYQ
jgi:hypothetical protein